MNGSFWQILTERPEPQFANNVDRRIWKAKRLWDADLCKKPACSSVSSSFLGTNSGASLLELLNGSLAALQAQSSREPGEKAAANDSNDDLQQDTTIRLLTAHNHPWNTPAGAISNQTQLPSILDQLNRIGSSNGRVSTKILASESSEPSATSQSSPLAVTSNSSTSSRLVEGPNKGIHHHDYESLGVPGAHGAQTNLPLSESQSMGAEDIGGGFRPTVRTPEATTSSTTLEIGELASADTRAGAKGKTKSTLNEDRLAARMQGPEGMSNPRGPCSSCTRLGRECMILKDEEERGGRCDGCVGRHSSELDCNILGPKQRMEKSLGMWNRDRMRDSRKRDYYISVIETSREILLGEGTTMDLHIMGNGSTQGLAKWIGEFDDLREWKHIDPNYALPPGSRASTSERLTD